MEATSESCGKTTLLHRMKQRTDNLAHKAEIRRSEKEDTKVSTENANYFQEVFQSMKEEIENKVDNSGSIEKNELIVYLDDLVKDLQKMQNFLNESSMFLASFQIKIGQESINELNRVAQAKISELQPKKKFGFRTQQIVVVDTVKEEVKENNKDVTDSCNLQKKNALENMVEKSFFGFKNNSNAILTMSAVDLESRQLNLLNLENCKVIALGNPSTLQVASLKNCIVIVGPTSRSAFIKDCKDCNFVIACQQLRIHESCNTNFYLHVTGAAIVEGCSGVSFAPYNLSYPELQDHYTLSGLDSSVNNWDKIDDFRWLNENEKSPNWSIIPDNERVKDWL